MYNTVIANPTATWIWDPAVCCFFRTCRIQLRQVRHLGVGAGKDSTIYVFDRDNMGKFNPIR